MFLGSCLVSGRDFTPFRRLWIEGLDAAAMRHPGGTTPRALLYTQRLFDEAEGYLRTNAGVAARLRDQKRKNRPLTPLEEKAVTTEFDLRLCLTDFKGFCVGTVDALGHRLDAETKSHVEGFTDVHLASPSLVGDAAKAARATSAFPGLFDPVTIRDRWFVDGGLWNNQPIDQALRAIRDRPAYGRTHRVVMFIEPNPSRSGPEGGPVPPAPTLIENVSIIPGIGMKGSILPALEGLLDINRRLEYFETLVKGIRNEATALGSKELENARGELRGENVGQDGITLLNKIRIEQTLLDNDSRRIQAFRSLRAQFAVIDVHLELGYEKQLIEAMLGRLRSLNELDLRQRATRREISDYNETLWNDLHDQKTAKREETSRRKGYLYTKLREINDKLDAALGGRARPFETTGFGKGFDAFSESAVKWLQDLGGVNQGQRGLQIFLAYPDPIQAIAAEGAPLPPIQETPTPEGATPSGEDAWRHVIAGISDLDAKSRIDLIRISPNDVDNHHLIGEQIGDHETAAQVKLSSDGLGHVQGLFEARWRRNDYVWGRLDAAEILLRTLQRFGAQTGRPMQDEEYRETLLELQSEILREEADAHPEMVGQPVGAFPAERPEGVKIAANRALIGYGREKVPDADEPRFAAKLNGLIEAAQKSLNGSPKIAVAGLSYLSRFARILAFLLGLTRPIWPKPYKFGARLMGLGLIVALIVAAYYVGLKGMVPAQVFGIKLTKASGPPPAILLDSKNVTLIGVAALALACLGAGLGIDLWIALPLLFVAGYLAGRRANEVDPNTISQVEGYVREALVLLLAWTLLKRTSRLGDFVVRKVKGWVQKTTVAPIKRLSGKIKGLALNGVYKIVGRLKQRR